MEMRRLKQYLPMVIIAVFCIKCLLLSILTLPYLTPDEKYHIELVERNKTEIFYTSVEDLEGTGFGASAVQTPLYYMLFSKLLLLNVTPLPNYMFLRLLNVVLSMGTVWIFYLFLKKQTSSLLFQTLFLLLLTNIPSFTSVSIGVTYDNLTNLLAVSSFYFLYRWQQEKKDEFFGWWLVCALLATLTKKTLWPLLLIQVGFILWQKTNLHNWRENVKLFTMSRKGKWIAGTVLVLGIANILWVGRNLLLYKSITPTCLALYSEDLCQLNYIFYRTQLLFEMLPPVSSLEVIITRSIVFLLFWPIGMLQSVLTIGAHKLFITPDWVVGAGLIFILSALVGFLKSKKSSVEMFWAISSLAYSGMLALLVNFYPYLIYGFWLDMNGRYLFPVLFPILYLGIKGFLFWYKPILMPVLILVCIWFFCMDTGRLIFTLPVDWTILWEEWRGIEHVEETSSYLDSPHYDFFPFTKEDIERRYRSLD